MLAEKARHDPIRVMARDLGRDGRGGLRTPGAGRQARSRRRCGRSRRAAADASGRSDAERRGARDVQFRAGASASCATAGTRVEAGTSVIRLMRRASLQRPARAVGCAGPRGGPMRRAVPAAESRWRAACGVAGPRTRCGRAIMTALPTAAQGWLYLAVLLDLRSRLRGRVGGPLATLEDRSVAGAAWQMARRVSRQTAPHWLHHSDRGCQHTSDRLSASVLTAASGVAAA